MRILSVIQIGALSLALVLGGRALYLEHETQQRERLTEQLCDLVGNYLETNAVRSAFEGMQQALVRSDYPNACITILDSGKHYSPDCIETGISYQFTLCKAEGNRDIRAEIHYPTAPFFPSKIIALWLALWVMILCTINGMRTLSTHFAKRMTNELCSRLFADTASSKEIGPIARLSKWLVVKSGILSGVRAQADQFEQKVRAYEGRIRAESALRAQKEVESRKANDRLEEIRKIRHDLGSPLSSFLSVQERFIGDAVTRQALTSGIQKIQRMLDRLAKSECDSDSPRLTIVETVAAETIALLSVRFLTAKGIELTLGYDARELSPVNATADGLSRILSNLLENAFDASPNGAQIVVRIESNETECQISVDDDGSGVPSEIQATLFEKGATFGKVGGTGYGLHHSKQLVESWNGTIHFEQKSKGSRFIITLPRLQTRTAFVGLPDTKRLWVIDDDRTVADTLDQSGFEVVASAITFDEGRAQLRRPIPEKTAILVDFRLDGGRIGTDLIAGHTSVGNIFLCTNDYENPEVVRLATEIGVPVLPKPLCFLSSATLATAEATS